MTFILVVIFLSVAARITHKRSSWNGVNKKWTVVYSSYLQRL